MDLPFYYRLVFSLFAYNSNDDLKQQQHSIDFKDSDPLKAREKAFEEFEEYLDWLKSINRIKQTEDNYLITQPSVVSDPIKSLRKEVDKKKESNDDNWFSKYFELEELYKKYEETIRIDFVIDAQQYTIHKVSSFDYDPEEVLLDLVEEYFQYQRFKVDTCGNEIKVEYYGEDYNEISHEIDAGTYTILKTPRKFISEKPSEESEDNEISHESIISGGESKYIEFKPALLYNFKTGEAGISVKYIIAKAIAAFLNTDGGLLYIGVTDEGVVQGLDYDYSILEGNKKDKLKLEFDQLIRHFFPAFVSNYIQTQIIGIQEKEVYVISVHASKQPVVLWNKRGDFVKKEFYKRTEASSISIDDIEQIIDFIFNNKNFKPNFDD